MSLQVTSPAPKFKAQAVVNGDIKEISLDDYLSKGKWVVLFFYPMDFTFVCPTEIIAFSNAAAEYEKEGIQLLACSVDNPYVHLAWVNTPRKQGGLGEVNFPIIADLDKSIAANFGVLLPMGVALRGLFIIDPKGVVRSSTVNDLPVGRNVEEPLRIVKAFKFVEEHGEVCPANWHEGDKTMKADPKGSQSYFSTAN